MAIRFSSIDYLFTSCAAHLDYTNSRNTEIENYLVQHILVRICAEFEPKLVEIFERRCERNNDEPVRTFSKNNVKKFLKEFNVGDIGKMLGMFNPQYRANFDAAVMDKKPHIAWNNIYHNRVTSAHRLGTAVEMTLDDLEAAYNDSLLVFDALIQALEFRMPELRRIR